MQKWYDSECETSFLGNVKNGLEKKWVWGKKKIEHLQKEKVCILCDEGLDDRLISQWNEGRVDIRKYDVKITWKKLKNHITEVKGVMLVGNGGMVK